MTKSKNAPRIYLTHSTLEKRRTDSGSTELRKGNLVYTVNYEGKDGEFLSEGASRNYIQQPDRFFWNLEFGAYDNKLLKFFLQGTIKHGGYYLNDKWIDSTEYIANYLKKAKEEKIDTIISKTLNVLSYLFMGFLFFKFTLVMSILFFIFMAHTMYISLSILGFNESRILYVKTVLFHLNSFFTFLSDFIFLFYIYFADLVKDIREERADR